MVVLRQAPRPITESAVVRFHLPGVLCFDRARLPARQLCVRHPIAGIAGRAAAQGSAVRRMGGHQYYPPQAPCDGLRWTVCWPSPSAPPAASPRADKEPGALRRSGLCRVLQMLRHSLGAAGRRALGAAAPRAPQHGMVADVAVAQSTEEGGRDRASCVKATPTSPPCVRADGAKQETELGRRQSKTQVVNWAARALSLPSKKKSSRRAGGAATTHTNQGTRQHEQKDGSRGQGQAQEEQQQAGGNKETASPGQEEKGTAEQGNKDKGHARGNRAGSKAGTDRETEGGRAIRTYREQQGEGGQQRQVIREGTARNTGEHARAQGKGHST